MPDCITYEGQSVQGSYAPYFVAERILPGPWIVERFGTNTPSEAIRSAKARAGWNKASLFRVTDASGKVVWTNEAAGEGDHGVQAGKDS